MQLYIFFVAETKLDDVLHAQLGNDQTGYKKYHFSSQGHWCECRLWRVLL